MKSDPRSRIDRAGAPRKMRQSSAPPVRRSPAVALPLEPGRGFVIDDRTYLPLSIAECTDRTGRPTHVYVLQSTCAECDRSFTFKSNDYSAANGLLERSCGRHGRTQHRAAFTGLRDGRRRGKVQLWMKR